jgi:hypothetical protein
VRVSKLKHLDTCNNRCFNRNRDLALVTATVVATASELCALGLEVTISQRGPCFPTAPGKASLTGRIRAWG